MPESKPSVSICIPTYNRVHYLKRCVDAALRQTLADFELVISDNASSDGTQAYVEGLNDLRVRYIRHPVNRGSQHNWNHCLQLARGEFIVICHDDDWYEPTFLERAYHVFSTTPGVGLVYTAAYLVNEQGRRMGCLRVYPRDQHWDQVALAMHFLKNNHDIVFSSVMVRRAAYERVGLFDPELFCGDFEMWLKLAFLFKVAYISTPLVSYRSHSASTTLNIRPHRYLEENRLIVNRFLDWVAVRQPQLTAMRQEALAAVDRVWIERLLTTAWALVAEGAFDKAASYLEVLRQMQGSWLTDWKVAIAGGCLNPLGQRLAQSFRAVRRLIRRMQLVQAAG